MLLFFAFRFMPDYFRHYDLDISIFDFASH